MAPPLPGQEEWSQSGSIAKLAKAFVAFRAKAPHKIDKDKAGYNYNYTTLGHLIETYQPLLSKHGLAVLQGPVSAPGALGVVTTLLHESGEYVRFRFLLPIPSLSSTNVAQDAGAAITYARRYGYGAVICVASEEDTDAATD